MIKWFFVAIMLIHGLIHLMGGVNELGLAKIEGLSGKTLVNIPGNLQTLLGICWFAVVLLFLLSLTGLIANQEWWKTVGVIAVIISQGLVVIWWPSAKWGTIANILIILGIIFPIF